MAVEEDTLEKGQSRRIEPVAVDAYAEDAAPHSPGSAAGTLYSILYCIECPPREEGFHGSLVVNRGILPKLVDTTATRALQLILPTATILLQLQ